MIPYEEYTPQNLWAKVAAPDSRFWNATGAYGVPMNLTWISGTMFAVSCLGVGPIPARTHVQGIAVRSRIGHGHEVPPSA